MSNTPIFQVLNPGDRVLVIFGREATADRVRSTMKDLGERFPGVEFTGLGGAIETVVVKPAETHADD